MFNWSKSDGLKRHKISGVTSLQLDEHLILFYRHAGECGESIVRMKMVIRPISDLRNNYAIIWTKGSV